MLLYSTYLPTVVQSDIEVYWDAPLCFTALNNFAPVALDLPNFISAT